MVSTPKKLRFHPFDDFLRPVGDQNSKPVYEASFGAPFKRKPATGGGDVETDPTSVLGMMPKSDDTLQMQGFVDNPSFREKVYRPTGHANTYMTDDESFGKKWLDDFILHVKRFQKLKIVRFLNVVAGISRAETNPLSDNNFNLLIHQLKQYVDVHKQSYQSETQKQKTRGLTDPTDFILQKEVGGVAGSDVLTGLDIARAGPTRASGSSPAAARRVLNRNAGKGIREQLTSVNEAFNAANPAAGGFASNNPAANLDVENQIELGGGDSDGEYDSGSNKNISTAGVKAIPPLLKPGAFGAASLQEAISHGKGAFLQWLLSIDSVNNETLALARMIFPDQDEPPEFVSTLPMISGFFMIDNGVQAAVVEAVGEIRSYVDNRNGNMRGVDFDNLIDFYTEEFAIAVGSHVVLNSQVLFTIPADARQMYENKINRFVLLIGNDIVRTNRLQGKITHRDLQMQYSIKNKNLQISERRTEVRNNIAYYANAYGLQN